MGPVALAGVLLSLSPPTCSPFNLEVASIVLVIYYYKLFSLRKVRTGVVSSPCLCYYVVWEESQLVCAEGFM